MEYVSNTETVFLAHFFDELENRWNLRARNDAILRVIRRSQPAKRSKCVLATLPQKRAFIFVFGAAHLSRLLLITDFADRFRLFFNLFGQAFQFNQQHGTRVERIACVTCGFNSAQRPAIQHFQRRWSDACGGDRGDRARTIVYGLEDPEQCRYSFRPPQQPHDDFGDDADRALRAHTESGQVVAITLGSLPSVVHYFTIWQHNRQSGYVVDGNAIS